MKKSLLITLAALLALTMSSFAQETHFDFSITNATGYDLYYRIVDAANHHVEVTYPCQNGDYYWWGYIKPEGKLMLADTVSYEGIDYTVVAIGDHAFCGCSDLRGELEFPQTINSIGTGAFKGCTYLSGSLNLPVGLTRIEDETFSGCSSLSGKLVLPDLTQYVGKQAFLDCSSLTGMMKMPASLAFIGEAAFKGCTKIGAINVKATTVPTTAADAFDAINSWIEVDVPYNMKEAYQTAPGWSRFGSFIVEKSIWTGNAEPWTQGSGTTDDPFLIESAENLAWLAQSVNQRQADVDTITGYSPGGAYWIDYIYHDVYAYQDTCFRLVIDIDLQKGQGLYWNSIGAAHDLSQPDYYGNSRYYSYFSGNFDGDHHSINNYSLYVGYWDSWSDLVRQHQGLFGLVYDASISNIYVSNCRLNMQQGCRTGGIVGVGIQSTIINCHLSGEFIAGNIGFNNGGGYIGGIAGTATACRIENCTVQANFKAYTSITGGIVAQMIVDPLHNQNDGVVNCSYCGIMNDLSGSVGGIIGQCSSTTENAGVIRVQHCFSRGSMTNGYLENYGEMRNTKFGGIVGNVLGIDSLIVLNCYSNDTLTGNTSSAINNNAIAGGIIGKVNATTTLYVKNCYHVGSISSKYKGGILAQNTNMTLVRNCYFEAGCAPDDGFGVPLSSDYMKTEAFVSQLNNGSTVFRMDTEPFENGGYPVFGTDGLIFVGAEWYYEIHNNDGTITYQHLQCVGDTTINEERPKIIVRSNTHYDREGQTEVTHEYVYEENGIVYWWNKDLGKFTVLYDFGAEVGDEWTIEVGNETVTTQVYATELQYINGIPYKKLIIADPNDIFSGNLLSSIGHQTSFFPEMLMNQGKGYRVEGLRCYWLDDELIFKLGDEDCDAIYAELHNGVDEPMDGVAFAAYPNPANDVLFVETQCIASLPDQTYRITNLMGQTVLQGSIDAEKQQINIESLPAGMYFITFAGATQKFVVK